MRLPVGLCSAICLASVFGSSLSEASLAGAQAPAPTADAPTADAPTADAPPPPAPAPPAAPRPPAAPPPPPPPHPPPRGPPPAAGAHYASAAAAFREALAVRDAAPVRYNLAVALFELGEDPEAFRLARGLQADPEASGELRERASFLERELRARGVVLSIRLGGLADGARVAGRDLGSEELDEPIYLAPGDTEVIGIRGGEVTTRRQLTLRAGSDVYVDVSVVPTPAELAREEASVGDEGSTMGTRSARRRAGLYVGVAAAALAAVAVIVVAVAVTRDGTEAPVRGDFQPGVIRW